MLKANLDGSDNWTTIDAVSNDATMQDVNYTPFDFEMDVPGTYRYFRFEVSEVVSDDILQLGEMQLFYLGNTLPDGVTQGPTPDTYIVDYGTDVTVKAIPEAGYALLDWSDDHSTEDIHTVTVISDTNIVATFGILTPGLTPLGELTTYGHSFVSENGEIKSVPSITETGEFTKVVSREPTTIDLSTITEAITAQNGDTLKGTLDAKVKISIAKGATVMLDSVTINGTHSMSYLWAGITGGNIKAKGGVGAAGIGGGRGADCGDIHISGGTIIAEGGDDAAGIGGGGPIDINTQCGSITISSTVTSVTATAKTSAQNPAPNSIGAGKNGTGGAVTIGNTDYPDGISINPYTYPQP